MLGFDKMQAQFGREGARLWLLANGIDETPLIPRQHEQMVTFRFEFSDATASVQAIILAAEGLLRRGFNSPELAGRHVRKGQLSGEVDGGVA